MCHNRLIHHKDSGSIIESNHELISIKASTGMNKIGYGGNNSIE